jgi:signal transduction histidine kinase
MKFSDLKKDIDEKENSGNDNSVEKIKNLEVILNVINSINSSLILEDVLELVLKNAISLTGSDRGFIVLKNPDSKLEYKLGLDSDNTFLDENSFNISTTVVQDVFNTGQSKFIEGAQTDTGNDPSKSILRLELQTILCSPLITDDKKIGVIYVDSKHLHKIKIKELTDTFEILAGQAAVAIKNAQLFKEQVKAFNALQEANSLLIQAERKALKSSINSEIGHSLQGLVHLALLETESQLRTIEKVQKEFELKYNENNSLFFDRLKLKSNVAVDSIRNIQKYAQVLLETSVSNLNKDSRDLNQTIQSVIKYISPMKKFNKITFKTEFNNIPLCSYDSDQIQNLLVHVFSNSAEARNDAAIEVKSYVNENNIFVEINDNGPGIPEEFLSNIFELPTHNKSGYGLFLCKSIIDRHKGEINLWSKPTGTSIRFTLPVI